MIICTIGSTLLVPLIHLDFEVRREYIAKVLCINQDEPIAICGGKCYLTERLDFVADFQEKNAPHTERFQISFYFEQHSAISLDNPSPSLSDLKLGYVSFEMPTLRSVDIFHPPQLSA
ncbi:MAG: hypothetical protein AAFX87_15720 [Bacteroidota bacterium]